MDCFSAKKLSFVAGALVALCTSGCFSKRLDDSTIKITGSDTMLQLAQVWAEVLGVDVEVEQPLASAWAAGTVLSIAWEELASMRAPRFVADQRVLVCLTPLPGSTLWQKRFPDAKARQKTLAVAHGGDAFLREPRPGSVDELEHFAKLPAGLRAGATGSSRLLALAAQAELPLAEEAVERPIKSSEGGERQ